METEDIMLGIDQIIARSERPKIFEQCGGSLWTDPYVSKQMLAAHLDPNTDAASRRPETIERSVSWIINKLHLSSNNTVLDLGCGPGLYSIRFASKGVAVTGVDISAESISYAKSEASNRGLEIEYRLKDYRYLEDRNRYDAVLLIYGDYCVLGPKDRMQLLVTVRTALKSQGHFVLDVSTRQNRKHNGLKNGWYASRAGFWCGSPHLVLEEGFDYPEENVYLDQYTIIDQDANLMIYRNWFQDFSKETILKELETQGFAAEGIWSDLCGSPYREDSEWIGLIMKQNSV